MHRVTRETRVRACVRAWLGGLASAAVLALAPQPSAAESAFDASWLGRDPAQRGTATELVAKLVRRAGGEWVIVQLGPPAPAPAAIAAAGPPASLAPSEPARVDDYFAVQAALRDYERAFERRDAALLSRVWSMNPSEMDQVGHLFEQSRAISVSIEDSLIRVDGDDATVRFAQKMTASRRSASPHFRRRSVRSLMASDAAGSWEIEDVLGAD